MKMVKREVKEEAILSLSVADYKFIVNYDNYSCLTFKWSKIGEEDKEIILRLSESESNTLINFIKWLFTK